MYGDLEANVVVKSSSPSEDSTSFNASTVDESPVDTTVNATSAGAGTVGAGTMNRGTVDAGTVDAETVDAGTVDAGTVSAEKNYEQPYISNCGHKFHRHCVFEWLTYKPGSGCPECRQKITVNR